MLAVFADMVTLLLAVHPLTRVASGWVTLAGSADGTFQRKIKATSLDMREVVELVIFGKQHRRYRTIGLGDDPEFDAGGGVID